LSSIRCALNAERHYYKQGFDQEFIDALTNDQDAPLPMQDRETL
jgi:hypothetical protein